LRPLTPTHPVVIG